jgi:TatA/E family protein of Tat protein translocase
MLGSWEIVLILFFIGLLFGPNKIIELFKLLQKGTQEFKQSITSSKDLNKNK